MTGYATQFDRVRTHDLGNHPALRYSEVVRESPVQEAADLNNGRVGDE